MQYDVSLVSCSSYEEAECTRAMEEVLAPLGGLDWVTSGMKIAVKVNLVSAMKPETAATTHPVLLRVLIRMLKERGAQVVLGDSPGGLYNAAHLNHVYEVTGLKELEKDGALLNQNFSQRSVRNPNAIQAKSFQYTAWLDDADAIIDFCKLKTHGQMGMTCATKNFFGVIPGTMKPEYHYQYPKAADFADMLVDLSEYFKPKLCICDAVVGMEGNGPTQGSPRKIGLLAASLSCHKLDLVCAKLLGFSMPEIPTLQAAFNRGLIPAEPEELSVFGDMQAYVQKDVQKTPAQKSLFFVDEKKSFVGKLANGVLLRVLTPFPKVEKKTCIGCGKCANICPAKAITMQKGLPVIDRKVCIHCFCCQEFCRKGAMRVGRSPIAKLLNR